MNVVTLVSDPEALALVPDLVTGLAQALGAEPEVLADREAVAFRLPAVDQELRQRLTGILDNQPVDIVVTPAANRTKRILICDMDSTVITTECIDELADLLGIRAEVAAITEHTMNGELDFASSVKARVALLEGLEESAIERLLAERIHLTPGAGTLVRTMRAHGAHTALISGGFTRFTGPVAARAGFDEHRANELEIADHRLTGRLLPPLLDADAKLRALDELAARLGLARDDVLAAGDGANDIPMIKAAGLGVGFRPHAKVAAVAPAVIRNGDLTALLFIQGYPKSAFRH
ncbi:MAG TPA: phosphoserine phosphatase SerB [Geminicoccus sp.]|jgi:phosphoserine phosphatase|uniref:phosphoserine phosphatase SerB n=1 Tax=Geminicoccus sp. TaxID=2024832 RepID=UPI002E37A57C|nr:phosphoserine phosphatase SerB [Geminicoccus sp.]HEX2527275.1 phosphoserine phosphatase SerB [Geminicoccus sp.]